MNAGEDYSSTPDLRSLPVAEEPTTNGQESHKRPLHRLGAVRKQQGVSRRNIARRLNVPLETVREQEDETADLPLSVLYAWQQVLDAPIGSLLVDSNEPLSAPVMVRAKMVRLMKTATALLERADGQRVRRLATMLVEQLVELMPELKHITPWHAVGRRRSLEDYGRILEHIVPDEFFRHSSGS